MSMQGCIEGERDYEEKKSGSFLSPILRSDSLFDTRV